MKKYLLFSVLMLLLAAARAQIMPVDTTTYGTVTVNKDDRINILGEKMYEYNVALAKANRSSKGFRLMLLTTNDRNLAMQLRTKLLQQYPEHKVYMVFQSPFIKLKMGNFEDRDEAESLKKQLLQQKITPGNIYIIPEKIEIKPEKEEDQDN